MPHFITDKDTLVWNWKTADLGEFACPFMLAANIYRKEDYIRYVSCLSFANPSTFEMQLQGVWQYSERKNELPDNCASLKHQTLVHSVNNRVQVVSLNANGLEYPYSTSLLNEYYLAGQIVELSKLDFSQVNGLHKEIAFSFQKL
jgi:hypothetical protein